jgi:hypothetical protein
MAKGLHLLSWMGAFATPLADGILDPLYAMSCVGIVLQVNASKSVELICGHNKGGLGHVCGGMRASRGREDKDGYAMEVLIPFPFDNHA